MSDASSEPSGAAEAAAAAVEEVATTTVAYTRGDPASALPDSESEPEEREELDCKWVAPTILVAPAALNGAVVAAMRTYIDKRRDSLWVADRPDGARGGATGATARRARRRRARARARAAPASTRSRRAFGRPSWRRRCARCSTSSTPRRRGGRRLHGPVLPLRHAQREGAVHAAPLAQGDYREHIECAGLDDDDGEDAALRRLCAVVCLSDAPVAGGPPALPASGRHRRAGRRRHPPVPACPLHPVETTCAAAGEPHLYATTYLL